MDELQQALTLQEGVQPAIDALNAHNHSGELGNKIPEGGLEDGAVSTAKIQQGAVTTDCLADSAVNASKIANGSITLSKLSTDVQFSGGGALGLTNYISEGFKITPAAGLMTVISAGGASIDSKIQRTLTPTMLNLSPNMASLVYAQKSETEDVPIIGLQGVQLPPVVPGEHVVRYIFNNKVNDTTILDTSGNGYDLTIFGGCILVDGWFDKSIKGDGSTGYMKTSLGALLPSGGSQRQATIVFSVAKTETSQCLFQYGSNDSNGFALWIVNSRFYIDGNGATNTGFPVIEGKTYNATLWNDGYETKLFINGICVYRASKTFNTTLNSNNLWLFEYIGGGAYYSTSTIHYFEIRNRAMTATEIAIMSNQLLFPVRHQAPLAIEPPIPSEAKAHTWGFNELSGNTAMDDQGTFPMTVVGTCPILNSDLGRGKAWRLGFGNNYFTSGAATFGLDSEFTIIVVFKPSTWGSSSDIRPLFANYNAAGGMILAMSYHGNGKISVWNASQSWQAIGTKIVPLYVPNFVAITFKNGRMTLYHNSLTPDSITNFTLNQNAYPLMFGYYGTSGNTADSLFEYVAYIPRELPTAELAQYYNAFMTSQKRSIVTDALPANSISLGFVHTNSNAVTEVHDGIYYYGRREGTTGIARIFTGWTRVSVNMGTVSIDNPLGATNTRVAQGCFKQDLFDEKFTPLMGAFYFGSYSTSMTYYQRGVDISEVSAFRISFVHDNANGYVNWHNYGASNPTDGYVGLWLEVDE